MHLVFPFQHPNDSEGMKTGSFKINIRLFGFEGICVNLETSLGKNLCSPEFPK